MKLSYFAKTLIVLAAVRRIIEFYLTNWFRFTANPPVNPCNPSPCGAGAICRTRGAGVSCECEPGLYGDPYTGCRPECLADSDCSPTRACLRSHCRDPCQGTCGVGADCETVNHIPLCSCPPGTRGNAFERCEVITTRKELFFLLYNRIKYLEVRNRRQK